MANDSLRTDLLATIRNENLNVYRASAQRLREDVGQEHQIAQDYRGRLIFELLQNADDAMATEDSGAACIRFELTDDSLWVCNSGRPLDEADVRGLCGVSASSKVLSGGSRRATIGHKGMGFKSVLEITQSPMVYSTSISFRFGPDEALAAVRSLDLSGSGRDVQRAPVTRFPWPIESFPEKWELLQREGMRTAFRFPLREDLTAEQRDQLAAALLSLPETTLLFLKNFKRVEILVNRRDSQEQRCWTVERWLDPASQSNGQTGVISQIDLRPDTSSPKVFLLVHDKDIPVGDHREGLDAYTWEGVEWTEVSVAVPIFEKQIEPIEPAIRKLHVFLPSGEPCPFNFLISGAFNSNLSRQEIRVEDDSRNYNRFLLHEAARLLRDKLIPALLKIGVSGEMSLDILRRDKSPRELEERPTAQALYEEIFDAFRNHMFVSKESGALISPLECCIPPLVKKEAVGRAFRQVLPEDAEFSGLQFPAEHLCGSTAGRILVDLGALELTPADAAEALHYADSVRSSARDDIENGVLADPVLDVLVGLWEGLEQDGRECLSEAARNSRLFPTAVHEDKTIQRISVRNLECFYPPRSIHGEVPLEGLCFLASAICWGALTPKERNLLLKDQLEAWQSLFRVRDFKFPDVMRASVLPALELDPSPETELNRQKLHELSRLAAICQLAGRTPNQNAPLPYERLGSNRALFNLSRLDVPCRKWESDTVVWKPAYQVYFGSEWVAENSVEHVLMACRDRSGEVPNVFFLVGPQELSGHLDRYSHLENAIADEIEPEDEEVNDDEDEEAALGADDRTRWYEFFTWLGVNSALRPVHFHDVEERAGGWLRTGGLSRPDGWAFEHIPADTWEEYRDLVRTSLQNADASRYEETEPYWYRIHDLEYLVQFIAAAARDESTVVGQALYSHLAGNWGLLERFSRVQVAQVQHGKDPRRRVKPSRAYGEELVEPCHDFWVNRLRAAKFCPTGHGPRNPNRVWMKTSEVDYRFGYSSREGRRAYLIPVLNADPVASRGKARAFAQVLGVREELTAAKFEMADARQVLERLELVFGSGTLDSNQLQQSLRLIIRPAYRRTIELLTGRISFADNSVQGGAVLRLAPMLADNGIGDYQFLPAEQVFYADRRDTRNRVVPTGTIWTFVIEASPGFRAPLRDYFGMGMLEENLKWFPVPGEPALEFQELGDFRSTFLEVAPYLLDRVAADRSGRDLVDRDARSLRQMTKVIEPVTHLSLSCSLDGSSLEVATDQSEAFVEINGRDVSSAYVVWNDSQSFCGPENAEALTAALCEVFGSGYFESFLALIRAPTEDARVRILRRSGAPLELEIKRQLLLESAATQAEPDDNLVPNPMTASQGTAEEVSAALPERGAAESINLTHSGLAPLYSLDQLSLAGSPIRILGTADIDPRIGEWKTTNTTSKTRSNSSATRGFGGRTDLDTLDDLGMAIATRFELQRVQKTMETARIFDWTAEIEQPDALVFDVSTPGRVDVARQYSTPFGEAINWLQNEIGLLAEWPGFDILTLNAKNEMPPERLIELKSSGCDARIQGMSWNEWKSARSEIRSHFYLYLVGNLRSDLQNASPFIRSIRDPFGQLAAKMQEQRQTNRSIQLNVLSFQEADHLELGVND